ncbi:MAG: hypothetical protein M3Y08_12345 [Fibrobacterota bacterium]|nr:hypothetical protein [Fibrobacterota bacterium]
MLFQEGIGGEKDRDKRERRAERFCHGLGEVEDWECLIVRRGFLFGKWDVTFLTRGAIDVLLTDYEMGALQNGIELAACFRVLRPETKLLLTSGASLPTILEILPEWLDFLPKPFNRMQLLNSVANLAYPDVQPHAAAA